MAVKSMLTWKSFMHSRLVLLGMLLCWGLSSCSPWERDLNKVYQAAQKGNKNAMLVFKEKACTLCSPLWSYFGVLPARWRKENDMIVRLILDRIIPQINDNSLIVLTVI